MLYLTNDRLIQKEKWNAYLSKLGQILVSGFDCHFHNRLEGVSCCEISRERLVFFIGKLYTSSPSKREKVNFLFYLEIGR